MTEPIRSSIEAASTYLMEHPDEARYTDSIATATVMDALHVRVVGPAGESIETDMPTAVGGSGEQAGPGWVFRAGLAACVASAGICRSNPKPIRIKCHDIAISLTCETSPRKKSFGRAYYKPCL